MKSALPGDGPSKILAIPLLALFFAVFAFLPACPKTPVEEEDPPFQEAVPGPLRAGAAVRLLDIPVSHPHGGYTQTPALGTPHPDDEPGSPFADLFPASRGIESPATARVIVLDNGHHLFVLGRLDLIYVTAELTTRVVHEVKERFDVDLTGKLLLNATHTHATGNRISKYSVLPEFGLTDNLPPNAQHALAHGGDTYSEESLTRIAVPTAEAIGEALSTRRPARIGWGTAENHTAVRDRRCDNDWAYGPGYFDPTVTVIRIDEEESGAPIAVAFHYGVHGTVNGVSNRNLSVDAPGHAEFKVEEAFSEPVVAVFLQGTEGDVAPSGGSRGHRGSQAMERYGWDVAATVMEAYQSIETRNEVKLQSTQRWVPISYPILGYDLDIDEFHYDGAIFCNFLYGGCDIEGPNATDKVLCAAPVIPDGGKYHTILAAARIDDLYFLTMPGEVMTEVGRLLREVGRAGGAQHTVVMGVAMDHEGYILTEEDWLSGGYEPTISFWGWKFGPYIMDQSADLLSEMLTGEALLRLPMETMPSFDPEPFDPITPTASSTPPAVDEDLPEEVERLAEVVFSFHGGDPGLGTPKVILERLGQGGDFEPFLAGGWRLVSNHNSPSLPLRYEPSPTPKEAPDAPARSHRFEIVWEVLPGTPVGTYRLAAAGRWMDGSQVQDYVLHSRGMKVVPSTDLRIEAKIVTGVTGPRLAVLLRYPVQETRFSDLPGSGGWQVGRFRMIDPLFAPPFVPVWQNGVAAEPAQVTVGGQSEPVELAFEEWEDLPASRTYEPGQGPGFAADLSGDGPWELTIPAGILQDAHGNLNMGPVTMVLEAP